jgi:hypothetical protein
MKTLSLTFALFAGILTTAAFAQEVAMNKASEHTIAEEARITPPVAYYTSFQAVVFPRNNGNIAVHIEKGKQEKVTVKVYDSRGNQVSEEKLGKHSLINTDYVTEGLPSGTYTFEIASQSKVYKKEVEIK